jgi:uncharacterized FAD-dependent dehydrogenase
MARINKDEVTKEALAAKFTLKLKEKDIKINNLEKQVAEVTKELASIKRGISIYTTDEEITKKILELRSKNYSPVKILDRFNHIGVDIQLETIKNIVGNIDELDSSLRLYYRECVENYEKEIRINPQILKQASLEDNQYQIDMMKEIIEATRENPNDHSTLSRYMDKLDIYIKTRNTIIKDTVLADKVVEHGDTIVNVMSNDFEEQKSKFFKFKINDEDVKVVS